MRYYHALLSHASLFLHMVRKVKNDQREKRKKKKDWNFCKATALCDLSLNYYKVTKAQKDRKEEMVVVWIQCPLSWKGTLSSFRESSEKLNTQTMARPQGQKNSEPVTSTASIPEAKSQLHNQPRMGVT